MTSHDLQGSGSEISDPSKPLSFGDLSEVVPCEASQLFAKHPADLNSGNYMFLTPEHGKQKPLAEQQQHLNNVSSLPSDDQHRQSNMWQVTSTKLNTPSQRHDVEPLSIQLGKNVCVEVMGMGLGYSDQRPFNSVQLYMDKLYTHDTCEHLHSLNTLLC